MHSGFKNTHKDFYLFIFRERGKEGEREGEKRQSVVALMHPLLGTYPATQACALTRNQSSSPVVCSPALTPLSYTSHSYTVAFTWLLVISVNE